MELKIGLSNGGFGAGRFVASLGSYNTGYTAHFVRPNSAKGGTSYSPKTLGVIFDGSLFSNLDLTRHVKKLLNKLNLSDCHG